MQKFLATVKLSDSSQAVVTFTSKVSSPEDALTEYNRAHPDQEILRIRRLHGGAREGAGRKRKYCEAGKAVWLPKTLADNADTVIPALIDLYNLCEEYKEMAAASPTSPRYDKLREFLANAESCLKDLKASVKAATGE